MSFLLVQLKCPYSHQQYVILISTTKMSLFTSTIYIYIYMSFLLVQLKCPYSHQQHINVTY